MAPVGHLTFGLEALIAQEMHFEDMDSFPFPPFGYKEKGGGWRKMEGNGKVC